MVEPENIEEWAEKLGVLCADAELRLRIGRAARLKLEQEYTWTERARRAAKLFN